MTYFFEQRTVLRADYTFGSTRIRTPLLVAVPQADLSQSNSVLRAAAQLQCRLCGEMSVSCMNGTDDTPCDLCELCAKVLANGPRLREDTGVFIVVIFQYTTEPRKTSRYII